MNNTHFQLNATLGGVVFSVLPLIDAESLIRTIVLAAIGAVTSTVISVIYRWIVKRFG